MREKIIRFKRGKGFYLDGIVKPIYSMFFLFHQIPFFYPLQEYNKDLLLQMLVWGKKLGFSIDRTKTKQLNEICS